MADSVVSTLIDQHRLAELRERTARHRPKGYRPPVPLDPLKGGAAGGSTGTLTIYPGMRKTEARVPPT